MQSLLPSVWLFLNMAVSLTAGEQGKTVQVETIVEGTGPPVSKDFSYQSHVTLYLDDGKKTPSGWSTRQEHGADADKPFRFQPGVGLIQGWTDGVLQMKVGERALLHVPAPLGYGDRAVGSPGGAFFVPAHSDLLFDIEVLEQQGKEEL